ncbi:MAG: S49 family peptidase, partial [Burkholderiales bacterium]
FFKALGFAYVTWFLVMLSGMLDRDAVRTERHTAVVDLTGVIEAEGDANAKQVGAALRRAFEDRNTAGVVLRINSPGGSAVQSGAIYDEIRRLRDRYPAIPLYAVVEEICASGGYYVAAAADRIFVNRASLVGSIGVLLNGFGFVGTMEKLGVERRLLTAGDNKGFLDPFSPLDEAQGAHARELLAEVHAQFVEAVRSGRGERLKEAPELFSGLVWSGARSVELGLADGFGSVPSVARDEVRAEKIVDFSSRDNLAERLAKRVGASVGAAFGNALGLAGRQVGLY